MRTLAALALVIAACAPGDRRDESSATSAPVSASSVGPEPFVLRVPRDGGRARVHHFPAVDSIAWNGSTRLPAPARGLSFDEESGILTLADSADRPVWIDFRRDAVGLAPRDIRMTEVVPASGARVYGIAPDGSVLRVGPSGDHWNFAPPVPATRALPQPDGWLLVLALDGEATRVWRLHPPQTDIADSAVLPRADRVVQTALGDRVYLASDSELLTLHGRDLEMLPTVVFDSRILDLVATPSGDRIFVARDGSSEIAMVDRYQGGVAGRISLPGAVRELRMDPFGRFLLARPASGDSAWVVALANDAVVGSVRTVWRADLPFVSNDGSIVLAAGSDVHLVDAATLQPVRTVADGASDIWYAFMWDGFRPRADQAATEEPEVAAQPEPEPEPADTVLPADTVDVVSDSALPMAPDSMIAPSQPGFIVSFAALLSEESARALASEITVDGQRPRVEATERAGTTIYRVLLGPFATREDAERAGRASGHSYWVYEENR